MKTNKLTLALACLIFSGFFGPGLIAQESMIKDRWNIKASYSRYYEGRTLITTNKEEKQRRSHFRLEGNYGLINTIEVGVYSGFSMFEMGYSPASYHPEDYLIPFYGLNVNYHLIPLFIDAADFRFDLYLAGKAGGHYYTTPSAFYWHGNEFDYSLGLGAGFYPWKHLGFYAEYSYGKYPFDENLNLRYGLTIKF